MAKIVFELARHLKIDSWVS